jgi:hypothetical protein
MPISSDQFEALGRDGSETFPDSAGRVLSFLAEYDDTAFRPAEIAAETGVGRDRLDAALPALESCGLARRRADYWAVGDPDRVAALAGGIHATRGVNDELGFEDPDEWMEYATGEKQ